MAKSFGNLRDQVVADPARARRVAEYREEIEQDLTLAQLRKARQLTQETIAQSLDTNQSGVSRIERQTDLYVSTLGRYVAALGGELRICAVFPDGQATVRIQRFEDLRGEPPT